MTASGSHESRHNCDMTGMRLGRDRCNEANGVGVVPALAERRRRGSQILGLAYARRLLTGHEHANSLATNVRGTAAAVWGRGESRAGGPPRGWQVKRAAACVELAAMHH